MTVAALDRQAGRRAAACRSCSASRCASSATASAASTCSSPASRWAWRRSRASARSPMRCASSFERQGEVLLGGDVRCRVRTRRPRAPSGPGCCKQGRVSETATVRAMARRPDGAEQALVELQGRRCGLSAGRHGEACGRHAARRRGPARARRRRRSDPARAARRSRSAIASRSAPSRCRSAPSSRPSPTRSPSA